MAVPDALMVSTWSPSSGTTSPLPSATASSLHATPQPGVAVPLSSSTTRSKPSCSPTRTSTSCRSHSPVGSAVCGSVDSGNGGPSGAGAGEGDSADAEGDSDGESDGDADGVPGDVSEVSGEGDDVVASLAEVGEVSVPQAASSSAAAASVPPSARPIVLPR